MEHSFTLSVPKPLIKDSLRAVLSTILFHRMLGSVSPSIRDSHLGVAYPVVLGEGGAEIDALVEDKVSLAVRAIDASPASAQAAMVCVRFLQQRPTPRKSGWFGTRTSAATEGDGVVWEKWNILVTAGSSSSSGQTSSSSRTTASGSRRNSAHSPAGAAAMASPNTPGTSPELLSIASDHLQTLLLKITTAAHKNTAYIPPITTTQIAPFPYEIVVYPSDLSGKPTTTEGITGTSGGNGEDESWGSVFKKILDN